MTMQDIKVGDTVEALESSTGFTAGNHYVVTQLCTSLGDPWLRCIDDIGAKNGWGVKRFKRVEETPSIQVGDYVTGHFDLEPYHNIKHGRVYEVIYENRGFISNQRLIDVKDLENGETFKTLYPCRFQKLEIVTEVPEGTEVTFVAYGTVSCPHDLTVGKAYQVFIEGEDAKIGDDIGDRRSVAAHHFVLMPEVSQKPNYSQILQDVQSFVSKTAENLRLTAEVQRQVEQNNKDLEKLRKCQKILTS